MRREDQRLVVLAVALAGMQHDLAVELGPLLLQAGDRARGAAAAEADAGDDRGERDDEDERRPPECRPAAPGESSGKLSLAHAGEHRLATDWSAPPARWSEAAQSGLPSLSITGLQSVVHTEPISEIGSVPVMPSTPVMHAPASSSVGRHVFAAVHVAVIAAFVSIEVSSCDGGRGEV